MAIRICRLNMINYNENDATYKNIFKTGLIFFMQNN